MKKENWELKKNVESFYSDEIYYHFFDGGYIKAEDFLFNKEQIEKVNNAKEIISSFLEFLESKKLIGENIDEDEE